MLGLLLFLRFDTVFAIAGVAAGLALIVLTADGFRVARRHAGAAALAAIPYYLGPLRRRHRSTDG